MHIKSVVGLCLAATSLLAQPPDFTPPTPLLAAAMKNQTTLAKNLLTGGANPNEGRLIGFTPIFFPILNQNVELLRAMIASGADLRAVDMAGSTTLMWAAADETGSTVILDELLKAGVDPNAANQLGETALQWAKRRGQSPVVALLERAGAIHAANNKAAVEKALALLQKSGEQFTRVSGCTSCHHQSVPQMASGLARQRGYAVNEKIAQQQAAAVVATYKPAVDLMNQGTDRIPDPAIGVSYALLGLHAEGYAGDEVTAAMAHLLFTKQRADGGFFVVPARPPIESSEITATALSLRAMQFYGKQPDAAVERARTWLMTAVARNTEERAMQLLGLAWANANAGNLAKLASSLKKDQRPDGGWAQIDTLESDAYATGQALYALHEAGVITSADALYRQGAAFLLRTQLSDGSWHVRSRAFPFQPLKESGFPHGRDQWISASGTGWAALALSLSPVQNPIESGGQ